LAIPVRRWFWALALGDFGEQLLVAEEKAGLEHLKGGAWHPFRRKWATERKDLPLVDVKATGGWRDTNTLLTCYQQTDEASMLRVMEAPRSCGVWGRLEPRKTTAKLRQAGK
jgi:hypothetical protein